MSYRHEVHRLPTAWILVGDRGRARLLTAGWPGLEDPSEIADFVCPEGNLSPHEVYSDSLGRNRDPQGRSYTDEPETDLRHATALSFARTIAEALDKGRMDNRFGHLVIVAPPLFLGTLRGCLSEPLRRVVELELNEELVRLQLPAIVDRLQRAMTTPAAADEG